MAKYPIFLELGGRRVVVVGGGVVAVRKAQVLLDAGARLVVVAERIDDMLTALCHGKNAKLIKSKYSKDYLVINEIPDVLVTGHFHQAGKEIYKGVRIATCGTFKNPHKTTKNTYALTSVGVFPVIDTGTGEITMIDLKQIP